MAALGLGALFFLPAAAVDIDEMYMGPQTEEEIGCIRQAKMQEQYEREVDQCLKDRMSSGISSDNCMNKEMYGTGAEVMRCVNAWSIDCACGDVPVDPTKCMLARLRACGAARALGAEMAQGSPCTKDNGCVDTEMYECWRKYDKTNRDAFRQLLTKAGCCSKESLERFFLKRIYLGEKTQLVCSAYMQWQDSSFGVQMYRQEVMVAAIVVGGVVVVVVVVVSFGVWRRHGPTNETKSFPLHMHNTRLLGSGGVPPPPSGHSTRDMAPAPVWDVAPNSDSD